MASIKTPMKRVRGLGAARGGTEHFWVHRLTAVSNIPSVIFFVFTIAALQGAEWVEVVAYFSSPITVILMLLAVTSITIHMRHGMQIIIEDYIHHEGLRVGLMMLNTYFAAFVALACAFSLIKLGFGI